MTKHQIVMKEKSDGTLDYTDYIGVDPSVKTIINFYKNEMKEKLKIALEPFKDKIPNPITIVWTIGEKDE